MDAQIKQLQTKGGLDLTKTASLNIRLNPEVTNNSFVKMIAMDLDSTLLKSDKTVTDYTVEVLSQCRQSGHMVVFATARSESECKSYIELINPHAIITNRGAIVRIGNDIIHRTTIDVETTNNLLMYFLNHPNAGFITAFTEKGYLVNIPADKHDPAWGEYNPDSYTDFSSGLDCDAYKITVEIFDDVTANEVLSAFPNIDVVRFTGEDWFSFANKSINKWEGIKALAAHIGIGLENTITFGDDYSDIEMLRECGIGVAVANAITEVKAVADIICDTNENNGVAKWINEHIL